jgi:hypothetical protein
MLVKNMNLSEEKKKPLRKLSMDKKIEMLAKNNRSQYVAKKKENAKNKIKSPSDYISYLSNTGMSVPNISTCIESLKVRLKERKKEKKVGLSCAKLISNY